MMRDAILNFAKQFKYNPKIENGKVKKYKRFVVAGMGGSHWAADMIKILKPELEIIIWPNYGLPAIDWKKTLLIASSYSGNTEEPIDALNHAIEKGIPAAAIAVGAKLLEVAKAKNIPYIQLPDTGVQPRSAIGFSFRAMLKLMKEKDLLTQSKELAKILKPAGLETAGNELAERAKGRVPIIYASAENCALPAIWKIKLNETGKMPAFCNYFPELNHNEMNSFDAKDSIRSICDKFYFIFLKDSEDHPQVQKRMEVTAKLYRDRSLPVEFIELTGATRLEKVFSSILLADWFAMRTAEIHGLESEPVPMVEELKKLIA